MKCGEGEPELVGSGAGQECQVQKWHIYIKRAEVMESTELSTWLNPKGCSPISQLFLDTGVEHLFYLFLTEATIKNEPSADSAVVNIATFEGGGELGTFSWDRVSDLWK